MAVPKKKTRKRESGRPVRMTRLVEGQPDPLEMLRARCREARRDDAAIDDVCFAVRRLAEAFDGANASNEKDELKRFDLPPGKEGVLIDLRRKAEEAETTHDPDIIKDLLDALAAFLGEELRERPGDEGDGGSILSDEEIEGGDAAEQEMGPEMGGVPVGDETTVDRMDGEPLPEKQMAPPSGPRAEPGGDEELGRRKAAAEADGFARYAAGPAMDAQQAPVLKPGDQTEAMSMQCEACGHEMQVGARSGGVMDQKNEIKKESATPATAETELATKLAEANRELDALRAKLRENGTQVVNMTEADRAELLVLRAEKELAEKTAKAMNAIREAGLDGIVEPAKLTAFAESQWPLMLDAIVNGAPARSYGTPQPEPVAVPERQARQARMTESAASYFKRQYDNAADGLGL